MHLRLACQTNRFIEQFIDPMVTASPPMDYRPVYKQTAHKLAIWIQRLTDSYKILIIEISSIVFSLENQGRK